DLYYINAEKDGGITCSQAKEFISDGIKDATLLFYSVSNGVNIHSPEIETDVKTCVLKGCGVSSLLLSDVHVLTWDERNSCIIGYKDAAELFGSRNVEGLEIEYNGQRFNVAGVTHSYRHIIWIPAADDDLLNRTILRPDVGVNASMIKMDLAEMGELGSFMPKFLIRWMLAMVLLIALIMVVTSMMRHYLRAERDALKRIIAILASAVLIFGYAVLFVRYPFDMIPPAWSDFIFWKMYMREVIDASYGFLHVGKTDGELHFIFRALGSFFWTGIFFFSGRIIHVHVSSKKA
ncbi:MAG: ABC transporter permease, partial [Firmicutes bacterium]|nr:ABC transporter permease [Bacillota bacterium]